MHAVQDHIDPISLFQGQVLPLEGEEKEVPLEEEQEQEEQEGQVEQEGQGQEELDQVEGQV